MLFYYHYKVNIHGCTKRVRCLLDAVESNKRYTLGGSHEKVYLLRFRYRLCCEYYAYNRYSRFCRAAACEEILTHF